MLKVPKSTREEAIDAVKSMLRENKEVFPLPFGDGNSMFVSSKKDAIRAIDAIEVDGKVYLIGFKK